MRRSSFPPASICLCAALLCASACGPSIVPEGDGTGGDDLPLTSTSAATPGEDETSVPEPIDDVEHGDVGEPECTGTPDCPLSLDVLVVVDNSNTMAGQQALLNSTMVQLGRQLTEIEDLDGNPLVIDNHVMVTTTDLSNPLCEPFKPAGYEPAAGSPVSTACTDRLEHFTAASGDPSIPEACTDICPQGVAPDGPFVIFGADESNLPDVEPIDVDGDGESDSPASQALACLGAVGISGCGYESPLEAMRRALDPGAAHNLGPDAFLRPNSILAIIIITDELDCSVQDESLMEDPSAWSVDPDLGMPFPSSALCWNAGVECEGPNAQGEYGNCVSIADGRLHTVDGYVEFLNTQLGAVTDRDVFMLPIVGVPVVLAHNANPPFEPIAGGAPDMVYRDWVDAPFPAGDLSEEDLAEGIDADDKRFEYGIGPGCSTFGNPPTTLRQGIAPRRMLDVCQSLNSKDGEGQERIRCCVESICDDSPRGTMNCLSGMVGSQYGSLSPLPKG